MFARAKVTSYFLTRDERIDIRGRRMPAAFRLRTWQARGKPPIALVDPLPPPHDVGPLAFAARLGSLLKWGYFGGGEFFFLARTSLPDELWAVRLTPCGPRFFDKPRFERLDPRDLTSMIDGPIDPTEE